RLGQSSPTVTQHGIALFVDVGTTPVVEHLTRGDVTVQVEDVVLRIQVRFVTDTQAVAEVRAVHCVVVVVHVHLSVTHSRGTFSQPFDVDVVPGDPEVSAIGGGVVVVADQRGLVPTLEVVPGDRDQVGGPHDVEQSVVHLELSTEVLRKFGAGVVPVVEPVVVHPHVGGPGDFHLVVLGVPVTAVPVRRVPFGEAVVGVGEGQVTKDDVVHVIDP